MVSPNDKPVLLGRMQIRLESNLERVGARLLASVGNYRSIERFVSRYGRATSLTTVLFHLARYLKWLREEKGVSDAGADN